MRIDKDCWLLNKPIAHRGLWEGSIIENSLPAYELAVEKSFPIEIDLYSTKDGEIVCFHDDCLYRMTGEKGYIYEKTLSELKSLSLKNTDQKIPTLKEVLRLVNDKVPLLIELKDQPNKSYISHVVKILKNYKGEFAIQSFNPLYLIKTKKLAPNFVLGILGTSTPPKDKNFIVKKIVKNLSLNFLIKPDFISYNFEGLPIKNPRKLPLLAWTITDEEQASTALKFANNIIFEKFSP